MAWPNRGVLHRPVVMGRRGVVASAHPLASLAGLRMLMQGGNAVDAVVATAAALNVCEPYMSGIGGVGYMVIYNAADGKLRTLDYIGRSAKSATPDAFATQDEEDHGPKSPLVPGAAAGWLTALEEAGRLDAATVFAPAIEYAEGGVPITLKNEVFFNGAAPHMAPETRATFLPDGAAPKPGTILKQPLLAQTFRDVVAGGKDAFYRGAIAEKIVSFLQSRGGLLTEQDLAEYEPEWLGTVSVNYRGFDIHCPPPPCSGFQYLQTLNILEGFDLAGSGQNSADTLHLLAEAMKLAVADRIAYTARAGAPFKALLSKEYAAERRALIDPRQAKLSEGERFDGHLTAGVITAGIPRECTTHFDAIDADGNAVSVTQTLGDGFGSGVMAGETGLMLNNFNYWFDLDRDSPNVIAPSKKVEMCLAPAVVMRDDRLFMVIGTPGSFGIMETTPQMISNVLDHGYSIQAAIEAPRIRTFEGTAISAEARIPESVRAELTRRGHEIRLLDDWSFSVGGGQGIMVDPDSGARLGGADPRRDGYAIGW